MVETQCTHCYRSLRQPGVLLRVQSFNFRLQNVEGSLGTGYRAGLLRLRKIGRLQLPRL